MHQGVDLKLCFVEGVLRRRDHIAIDNVTNPRIQTHLQKIVKIKIFLRNKKYQNYLPLWVTIWTHNLHR